MITSNGRIRCDECGKIIGRRDTGAISYTPFTSGYTPPDAEQICGACAAAQTPAQRTYQQTKCWIPEHALFS